MTIDVPPDIICAGCGVRVVQREHDADDHAVPNVPFLAVVFTRVKDLGTVTLGGKKVPITEYAQVCSRTCLRMVKTSWTRRDVVLSKLADDLPAWIDIDGEWVGVLWGARMPVCGPTRRKTKDARHRRLIRHILVANYERPSDPELRVQFDAAVAEILDLRSQIDAIYLPYRDAGGELPEEGWDLPVAERRQVRALVQAREVAVARLSCGCLVTRRIQMRNWVTSARYDTISIRRRAL
jgi:hypothetical protein